MDKELENAILFREEHLTKMVNKLKEEVKTLKEQLENSKKECAYYESEWTYAQLDIDHLGGEVSNLQDLLDEANQKLKNAIVPKFRVGQEVWVIYRRKVIKCIITSIATSITSDIRNINYWVNINHSLHLYAEKGLHITKEEAEEKLKQLREVIHE